MQPKLGECGVVRFSRSSSSLQAGTKLPLPPGQDRGEGALEIFCGLSKQYRGNKRGSEKMRDNRPPGLLLFYFRRHVRKTASSGGQNGGCTAKFAPRPL